MRNLIKYGQTAAIAILLAASIASWAAMRSAREDITASVDLFVQEAVKLRNGAAGMSYSRVELWTGLGEGATMVASYSDVTNYQEHDNHISFTHSDGHVSIPGDSYVVKCFE